MKGLGLAVAGLAVLFAVYGGLVAFCVARMAKGGKVLEEAQCEPGD